MSARKEGFISRMFTFIGGPIGALLVLGHLPQVLGVPLALLILAEWVWAIGWPLLLVILLGVSHHKK